jgi:hypothetical protein
MRFDSIVFESKETLAKYFSENSNLFQLTIKCKEGRNELPALPDKLWILKIEGPGEVIFDSLPRGLGSLTLQDIAVAELPPLPVTLTWMSLISCAKLARAASFPRSLRQLLIDDCPSLRQIAELPAQLVTFSLKDCSIIESRLRYPKTLKFLHLKNIDSSVANLVTLPAKLETLCLTGVDVAELPEFPRNLEIVVIDSCQKLINLPALSGRLRNLEIKNCLGLKADALRVGKFLISMS